MIQSEGNWFSCLLLFIDAATFTANGPKRADEHSQRGVSRSDGNLRAGRKIGVATFHSPLFNCIWFQRRAPRGGQSHRLRSFFLSLFISFLLSLIEPLLETFLSESWDSYWILQVDWILRRTAGRFQEAGVGGALAYGSHFHYLPPTRSTPVRRIYSRRIGRGAHHPNDEFSCRHSNGDFDCARTIFPTFSLFATSAQLTLT